MDVPRASPGGRAIIRNVPRNELGWTALRQGRDTVSPVDLRFYIDPGTGVPHTRGHGVTEDEVEQVLAKPGEDRAGREGSRVAIGQTHTGRYLRVIYVPDPTPNSIFVVTAFELTGKPLTAYRRRRKRKQTR